MLLLFSFIFVNTDDDDNDENNNSKKNNKFLYSYVKLFSCFCWNLKMRLIVESDVFLYTKKTKKHMLIKRAPLNHGKF